MYFKKFLYKIISFSVIFVMVFTLSFTTLNVLFTSATQNAELIYNGSISEIDTDVVSVSGTAVDFGAKENLLAGKYYDLRSFNANGEVPGRYYNANLEYMTDGIVNNVDAYSGRNMEFTFYLENFVDAEHFVLINRPEKSLQTFEYSIYGADSLAEVYSEDSLIATYQRSDAGTEDKQLNVFKLNSSVGIKYFRIKLIRANATDANSFRFCEIALLGNVTGSAVEDEVFQSEASSIPTEDTLTPTVKSFYANGTTATGVYNAGNLDDGTNNEFSSFFNFADYNGGNIKWYTNGDRYFDIVYDLGSVCDVKNILVLNHSNLYLRTGRYSIFAVEKDAELFETESKIADFTNDAKTQRQWWDWSNSPKTARYIALRIYDPVTDHGNANITKVTSSQNNIYTRLLEFRVYGTQKVVEPQDCELLYDGSLENAEEKNLFTVENKEISSEHENILENKYVDVSAYTSDGHKKNISSSGLSGITDKSVTISADADCGDYVDFNFFIRDAVTPEYFTVINRSEKNLQTYKYQIFASDTFKGLDSSEALLATYERGDSATEDKQCNIFKFNKDINLKYLRVRVLRGNYEFDKSARICEMMLYGKVTETDETQSVISDNCTDLPEFDSNLVIKNFISEGSNPDNNVTHKVYNTEALYDGAYDGEFSADTHFAAFKDDETKWYTDGSAYVTLTYDFGSSAKLDKILLLNHENIYLRTGEYELYASDSKGDLYSSEKLVVKFTNSERMQRQIFELQDVEGRYVGLKILDPVTDHGNTKLTSLNNSTQENHIYTRLLEFKVFGNYKDSEYLNQPTVTVINEKSQGKQLMSDAEFAELGESLISGQKASIKMNNIRVEALEKNTAGLTDGVVRTVYHKDGTVTAAHNDFSNNNVTGLINDKKPFDIIYKLGDGETLYDIDKAFYLGNGDSTNLYFTGKYQIYGSETLDDLFRSESLLFDYNYENDGFARGHIVTFKENRKPRICYFAIRILDPVSGATTWVYPRVSEIALYGAKADIKASPMNLADGMPVNAYLEKDGKFSNITSKNLTADEVKNLTDGNGATYAKIKTEGKTLEIVYNLCNEAEISNFYVESLASNKLKEFKIYATMDLNDIWSEDSMIYHYQESKTSPLVNGVTYKKPIKTRYVRISVINYTGGDYCYISNINIIGLDNQQLKFKSLTGGVLPEDVYVYEQNLKTKEIEYLDITETQAGGLFDTDKFTSDTIWGGKDGESSLNLQFYLGDLKNISRIEAFFLKNRDNYWPMDMDVYLAEDEISIMSPDAEPVYSFDSKAGEKGYSVDIVPQLARYVRLSFKKANPALKRIYETINIAFTEVVISGTNVKGQQRSDEYDGLLEFHDKETGFSWEIVRLDKNDIFTKVASSKLIKAEATAQQVSSLMEKTYYKIRDNLTYQIKFYDITGSEITDFSGRKVRVLIPIHEDLSYGQVLVGAANNADGVTLCDTKSVMKNNNTYVYSELNEETVYKFTVADLDNNDIKSEEEDGEGNTEDKENTEDYDSLIDEDFTAPELEAEKDNADDYDLISPSTGESRILMIKLFFSLFTSSLVLLFFRKKRLRRTENV